MVKPLDVYLGMELSPERQAAINAVRSLGGDEDCHAFWDDVRRVQDICERFKITPVQAAKALSVVSPYLSCDGEYGAMMVSDSSINGLVAAVGRTMTNPP